MDSYDVVIVGGGPAGSSCAWALKRAGLKVAILDRRVFPRNKVCGGWITPAVLEELQIQPAEYGSGCVLQPITGFRTSYMGGREVETCYGKPISYGIRRFEFDDYLLQRSGASFLLGKLGEQIASPIVTIHDDGIMVGAMGSKPFDGEGLATNRKRLVENGEHLNFVASSL